MDLFSSSESLSLSQPRTYFVIGFTDDQRYVKTFKKLNREEGEETPIEVKSIFDTVAYSGKIAAQCGHATLSAYQKLMKKNMFDLADEWADQGQKKIALKVGSEEELEAIVEGAKEEGLIVAKIRDAGHTQVAAGSLTVCAVGPGPEDLINNVTGHLKLL